MREKDHSIITFISTHWALRAQDVLENEFRIMIIPVPRDISAGCGIAFRTKPCDISGAAALLKKKGFSSNVFECYDFAGGETKCRKIS